MLDCVNISAQNSNERGCAQKSLLQQQVLDKQFWNNLQHLSKNLKAKIFNAILRISREPKSLIWCESLTQRTNNVVNLRKYRKFNKKHLTIGKKMQPRYRY
ncbi:hypothetical protein CNEO4_1670001 [Clostridium neonatale]|nr:hypothetical protein CNEO4_1670001 [Clostridium neonatale]